MLRTRIKAGPAAGLIMSLVFALFLTVAQVGDLLVPDWSPAFGRPTPVTLRLPFGFSHPSEEAPRLANPRVVVPRGTFLDAAQPEHRAAVAVSRAQRPPRPERVASAFFIFFVLTMALMTYLRRFGQPRIRLLRPQVGLLVAMGATVLLSKVWLLFWGFSPLWTPVSVVPLFVATAFDRRTAFTVNVMLAFAAASLVDFDLLALSVFLMRGGAATLLYLERKKPRDIILSGFLAGLSAVGLYIAMVVSFDGRFDIVKDIGKLMGSDLVACVGGGLGAGLLAAVLRSPAERLLGNVPRERLLDLQDLSQPLLGKLATDAPGTFEHSRAMANLAEQAASAIGADALLTRVGAYYHDLGKTAQAKYFVENLEPDERSPHDELDPDVSADAIMAHVVVGTKLLREGGIPEPVVEFCYTHHGTQLVEYFWNKCLQQGNPKGLDESHFRYPGMAPQTKEAAIVMIVDSIEAASRTIDPPSRHEFEAMVERIVYTKLKAGQLDHCSLDLGELNIIMTRVTDALVNMHHHRIKYPWQAKRAEEFGVPSEAVRPGSAPSLEATHPTLRPVRPSSRPELDGEAPSLRVVEASSSEPSLSPPLPVVSPLPSARKTSGVRDRLSETMPSARSSSRPPDRPDDD